MSIDGRLSHSVLTSVVTTDKYLLYLNLKITRHTVQCGICGLMAQRSLATRPKSSQVEGRILAGPLPGNSFEQAAHMHVLLSPSSII